LLGFFNRRRSRTYAFIVTYARSGSTLLQKILSSLPHSHFSGENNDALNGLWASFRSARLTREEQGSERRNGTGDPWRGAHLISPERYNKRLSEVFVDEIVQPPANSTLIGFKEVRYFDHEDDLEDYLDYIRMTFHPCLLIFNRRDADAVSRSAWWKGHAADIAAEVRKFDARIDAYSVRYPEESIIVDYDAYCADGDSLRPLFARLGAEFDRERILALMAEKLLH
jgi:hypothetical protein